MVVTKEDCALPVVFDPAETWDWGQNESAPAADPPSAVVLAGAKVAAADVVDDVWQAVQILHLAARLSSSAGASGSSAGAATAAWVTAATAA